jgi:hypothetical protein
MIRNRGMEWRLPPACHGRVTMAPLKVCTIGPQVVTLRPCNRQSPYPVWQKVEG